MNSKLLNLGGRILYALPLAVFASFHFMNAKNMASMVPKWLPGSEFWVYAIGLLLVLAAISVIAGKFTKWVTLILGILLLCFVLFVHLPLAQNNDPQIAMAATSNILKDASMAGAAFYICSQYWE